MIGVKNDNLDALILLSVQVLEEENLKRFDAAESAGTARPVSLDCKVRRLIRQEQNVRRPSARWMPMKRVVVAILIFCTVAFAAAMSIEAVRGAVWQAIVRWYDTYVAIAFSDTHAAPEPLCTKREPTDLPDSWVKDVCADSQSLYKLAYLQAGKRVLTYRQLPIESNAWVSNDETAIQNVKVGTFDAKLISLPENQTFILCWSDGEYKYALHSIADYITPELMIHIAESIE